MADDAGALLVRSGLVSSSALDDARARVATLGGTLGEQLVAGGAIADDALTDFYRSRLLVPQVNPNTLARLSPKVVGTIPSDMAIELRAIPVSLDGENNLTVAMGDPSDRHAVDEIAWFTGTYVVRAVATQMQIAWCLAHYYGHVTALGQRLLKTSGGESPIKVSAAVARPPRTRGLTGKVEATRHHAVAPVTGPIDLPRPTSGELDLAPLAAAVQVVPTVPLEQPAADAPDAVDGVHAADTAPVRAESAPATDGTPDQPRARSISGEIRVPVRRAPSIRPPMPDPLEDDTEDEDEGQVITIEAGSADEDPTGPARPAPARRRAQKSNPPELRERAGEVSLKSGDDRAIDADEPRIVIDQGALAQVPSVEISGEMNAVPHRNDTAQPESSVELLDDADSAPILLEKARAKRPITDDEDTGERNVVTLERRKPPTPRPERRTKVGIGAMPAVTRPHHDTETSGVPAMLDDAPTAAETRPDDPTTVDMRPAPPGDDTTSDEIAAPPPPASADDTNPNIIAPPPKPAPPRAPSPNVIVEDLDDDDEDEPAGPRTAVMSAVELDDAIPERSSDVLPAHLAKRHEPRVDYDPLDEGWGPPGTTIPPPLLGAIPGSDDRTSASSIPVPDMDSAPLIVAPPSLPLPAPGETTGPTKATLARALDEATERAMGLIRTLERTQTRDEVVDVMIAHLAETHHRAGFFVTRPSSPKGPVELSVFAIKPRPPLLPTVTLRLDRPSTLQDVVGTRLPYRGPMHDDASRSFLMSVLGACPPEILLVPIAIRERVVGVLFGEHRFRYTFDDQLALAARAAGMALERVLKARRS